MPMDGLQFRWISVPMNGFSVFGHNSVLIDVIQCLRTDFSTNGRISVFGHNSVLIDVIQWLRTDFSADGWISVPMDTIQCCLMQFSVWM